MCHQDLCVLLCAFVRQADRQVDNPFIPQQHMVFRVLEGSRRSIKFENEADTSFPITLMIVGVRKPLLILRLEGEKIQKHPHDGCVFHALNV